MMDNPKTFLLKKIIGYKDNGLPSLGSLHAEHVEDISKVMTDFAKEALNEITTRLNKGEQINFDGIILSLKKP